MRRWLGWVGLVVAAGMANATIVGVEFDGQVYSIDETTAAATLLPAVNSQFAAANAMAKNSAGVLYIAGGGGASTLDTINPTTGAITTGPVITLSLPSPVSIRSMAFNAAGVLYAVNNPDPFNVPIPYHLYTINTSTGVGTFVANVPAAIQGMTFSPSGTLYGWDVTNHPTAPGLVTIDPATGAVTDVNPAVGGNAFQVQTLAFSPAGVLYGAASSLYTIDTATGVLTLIGAFAQQNADIRGMEFVTAAPPSPAVSLTPASLAFGSQGVGTTSASQPLTLQNVGTATLNIGSIAASGDFAQTNNCGATLAASASCTINVTFTPTVAGVRSGAVTVTSDAPGSPHASSLSGTGTVAPTPAAVSLTPATLAFGSAVVGTTTAAQALTLQNIGGSTLNIASIAASGDFAQTNACGATLAPSATCTISVTFSPTALGARSGAVSVTSNAAGSPHTAALSGTGAAVPPSVGPTQEIPTLSEWGLIVLSLLMAIVTLCMRRTRAFMRR